MSFHPTRSRIRRPRLTPPVALPIQRECRFLLGGLWRSVGLLSLLVVSLGGGDAQAQVPSVPPPDPAGSGRGVILAAGLGPWEGGASGLLSLGVPVGRGEVVVRAAGSLGGSEESAADAGVLYGRRKVGMNGWLRYAGGLGLVRRSLSGPASRETDSSPGLLVQVDAVWSPRNTFGLGLGLHGALGRESFVGLTIGLYLGYAGLPAVQ